jgi:response regulator RpfG family c-di-GMP phosphodiesterase
MLVAPLRDARDEVVGVLQLMNSRGRGKVQPAQAVFTKADEAAVELFAGMASLALERAKLVRGAIMRTIATAEMRDPSETGAHVQRVAECAVAMYDRWAALHGVDDDVRERRRDELRIAAMLHDVGKVAIPDSILKKPGKLDEAEFERIKTHSVLGGRLFADAATPYDEAAMQVAVHHHERWDGTGYPGRFERTALAAMPADLQSVPAATALRGEDIPLFARLVAVADVYDALTSRRSYKEPWSDERVAEFLREESGRHFDPEIVEIALGLLPYFRSVRQRFDVDDRR